MNPGRPLPDRNANNCRSTICQMRDRLKYHKDTPG